MSADDHPVSDEQIDPVAVVAARLMSPEDRRDFAETTLEVKVGELAEAEQTRDQVKIAEANVAVAKAELGVAKAELRVAKAELGVAKAELVKAKQRGDLNQIADAELGVAKTEVSVAKAELWVAKAEVAVAAPDQQEAAKSVLVQAIRGLSIAQDAQQRALATGSVPDSVAAARMHLGAEAVEEILFNMKSMRLDMHAIKADQPKRRYLTPTAASGPGKEKYNDVIDGLQIRVETKPKNLVQRPAVRLNFAWPSLAEVLEQPETGATEEKRGQTAADHGQSADAQDTAVPPEESDSALAVYPLETDKKLEQTAYQPVLEFVSRLFPELNVQIVAEGKNLTSGNLFSVEVFTVRKENPDKHGQPVTFITTIEGRSDIAAFDKNGITTRRGVEFVIEIKTLKFNKVCGCREAITQLLGLNIENSLHSPPVLLTNLVGIHSVFFVAPLDAFPFYHIQEEQFQWFELALERVRGLCAEHRRTHHFGRGPSPDVFEDGS